MLSCLFVCLFGFFFVVVVVFFCFVLFGLVFLRSPAISLGFTTLGEIFAYVTVF